MCEILASLREYGCGLETCAMGWLSCRQIFSMKNTISTSGYWGWHLQKRCSSTTQGLTSETGGKSLKSRYALLDQRQCHFNVCSPLPS